jgi:nuclear polyadenylated RNA-binding protein 3
MTDNSPKVRASADLDVISPAPLHPPSPIIVPTLQDQADTYFNLAPHGDSSLPPIVTSVFKPPGMDNTDVPPISSHDNPPKPVQQTGALVPGAVNQNNTANVSSNGKNPVVMHNPVEDALRMLETSTHRPNISDTEQREPKPNKPIRSPGVPTLMIHQHEATSASEDDPAVSRDAPNPNLVPWSDSLMQPLHGLWGNGLNVVGVKPIQQRSERETTEYHVPPNTQYPAADTQAIADNAKSHAVAASPTGSVNSPADNDGPSQSIPLPPKPPMGQPNNPQAYSFPEGSVPHAQASVQSSTLSLSLSNATRNSGYTLALPGTFPVPPTVAASIPNNATTTAHTGPPTSEFQQQNWDTFLREERRHLSDAKWDKFPDGSRLFVGLYSRLSRDVHSLTSTGNLFSERVSKRDVFNIFSKYGRLAQISLKPSYGFVQYYTVEDGQAAVNNLQGIEVHGKRLSKY